MIEIHNLEVRFDVDGSDEEVFARLFRKFISQWSRVESERRRSETAAARDRTLGDREGEEGDEWR